MTSSEKRIPKRWTDGEDTVLQNEVLKQAPSSPHRHPWSSQQPGVERHGLEQSSRIAARADQQRLPQAVGEQALWGAEDGFLGPRRGQALARGNGKMWPSVCCQFPVYLSAEWLMNTGGP
ncbi:hypothetical protein TPAR_04489 [Tolypocladium paradoxum]|uniref:Uncharacterized protein n=1 Tax=Tolypocladium paradoxum TaxID=94208 RepID=A0A2S4KYQ2_9HYPO|nr:hypothetical protein TPAR_04489 [Tolypocladium paradoxum]